MRIAVAQVDPTVGDLEGNAALVAGCIRQAREAGSYLVAFPELVLSGYPPEDLVLKDHFLRDCARALAEVASVSRGITAIVGVPLAEGRYVHNCAAVLADGELQAIYRKIWLPNYAVFDEQRYFAPGDRVLMIHMAETRLSVNVCEDIWSPRGPTEEASLIGGAEVVVNISMSPYHVGKGEAREAMLFARARDVGAFIVYVNGVGGQDELVFDGHSVVFSPKGELIARAPQFKESLLLVELEPGEAAAVEGEGNAAGVWPLEILDLTSDLDSTGEGRKDRADTRAGAGVIIDIGGRKPVEKPAAASSVRPLPPITSASVPPMLGRLEEVYQALCLGVHDYVNKNRFRHVLIGLSGGIDSALTACVAVDALGAEAVTCVSMPSRFSSPGTQSDARTLAVNLGIEFLELPIEDIFAAYLSTLEPVFKDLAPDTAEENIQARIRGNLLMALSNKFGWLVLTTGNKSETAVGYATLYGDMAGGFAVIKDVPKTLVYDLSVYRNSLSVGGREPIPVSIIERPPSAELRFDQTDQDTLPPYEVLDEIIEEYVVNDESVEGMVERGLDRAEVERVVGMVDRNEYKRRQAAPGVRITPKAFGKDRRLPVTNRYRG